MMVARMPSFWSRVISAKLSSSTSVRQLKPYISFEHKRIRNIGLVAHIDAGKTTTTERMLYYSGSSEYMGEVHHGDTVMDYMDQERERGITITMAAATIKWLQFNINLIDTPGHVDFTFEVERSLSVLDGAVIILDGSVGVQAQTIKVWKQVSQYQIPSLFYINKMDKPSASVDKCLASVQRKLGIEPLLLQRAVIHRDCGLFTGLIDLVHGTYLQWPLNYQDRVGRDKFQQYSLLPVNDQSKPNSERLLDPDLELRYRDELYSERERLIIKLADYDEQLADHILSLDNINLVKPIQLIKSIRYLCLKRRLCPVLLGSSYRNIGIQPLLDSICHYLPNPMEKQSNRLLFDHYTRNQTKPSALENLCALAFKIHYHQRLGLLTYLRIYSGSISPGMNVFNLNRQKNEKIIKIYRPFADRFVDLTSGSRNSISKHTAESAQVSLGDIVAVSGLCQTITGDTLVHSSLSQLSLNSEVNLLELVAATNTQKNYNVANEEQNISRTPLLACIEIPEPVYYCFLECSSVSKLKQLEVALDHLQREDPSLRVSQDRNSQQLVIKGMGQLHIDIIKDRIHREYGILVETGPLQVSYKETISKDCSETLEYSKTIGGHLNQVRIKLKVKPESNFSQQSQTNNSYVETVDRTNKKKNIAHIVKIINTKDHNLSNQLRPLQLKAIYSGITKALEYGPLFSFPVVGVEVEIYEFEATNQTSTAFIANTISHCMLKALKHSGPILMEPIMKVEIITPEQFVGPIISDLVSRRSRLAAADIEKDSLWRDDNHLERYILAYVPLAEMFDYSTVLRTISSGMASLDIFLHSYFPVDSDKTAQIIKMISGIY